MRRALATALLLALATAGCRPPDPSPEAAYRAFASAARQGDAAAAWALLSEGSRAALDARAKALAADVAGAPATGRALLLGDLSAGAPRIEKIVVLRESAAEAVLGVTAAGAPQDEVRLVKEGGGWKVVVPG